VKPFYLSRCETVLPFKRNLCRYVEAKLLNCPTPVGYVTVTTQVTKEKKELPAGALAAIGVLGAAALLGVAMFIVMYRREKAGDPLFKQPLMRVEPKADHGDMNA
jgi:hypothetical protein